MFKSFLIVGLLQSHCIVFLLMSFVKGIKEKDSICP